MIKKLLLTSVFTLALSVQAQTTVFNEDFSEASNRALWTLEDRDNDGEFWEFADADTEDIESFQGWFALSWSWYFEVFTPDNTLISPSISLPATGSLELSFKVAALDDDEIFQEHYAVYVIPANADFLGTETPVFEETLDDHYYFEAKLVQVDISDFAGQDIKLVFRHYDSTDILYIGLDDVLITHQEDAGTTDFNDSTVSIYPNPTTDLVNIHSLDNINKIRVFDLNGKMIKEVKDSKQIDLTELQRGTYIINLYSDAKVFSKRVLKN